MKKTKDLAKVKTRLIELGCIDNEWLDKYLEIIEANLATKKSKKSTQAHHAIPVNDYWTSDKPYNRSEALKLARMDEINFEVNLLYKDHLLIHGYLTLCTDLDKSQQKYEAQADLRKINSRKGACSSTGQRNTIYVYKIIGNETINKRLNKEEVDAHLASGWFLGRKKSLTRCYIYKNGEYKNIATKHKLKYLHEGWIVVN